MVWLWTSCEYWLFPEFAETWAQRHVCLERRRLVEWFQRSHYSPTAFAFELKFQLLQNDATFLLWHRKCFEVHTVFSVSKSENQRLERKYLLQIWNVFCQEHRKNQKNQIQKCFFVVTQFIAAPNQIQRWNNNFELEMSF